MFPVAAIPRAGTARGGAAPAAPVNTAPPVIDNLAPVVGDTLTVTNGTWTGTPTSYSYNWIRAGVPIGAPDQNTYLVVLADTGAEIKCDVTATNATGSSDPAPSGGTALVESAPVNTVAPVISGNVSAPTENDTLSATSGTWVAHPSATDTYQWKRSSDAGGTADIQNAPGASTGTTYVVDGTIVGSYLFCDVTMTNARGNATARSNISGAVV